jgi:hypothetical protein
MSNGSDDDRRPQRESAHGGATTRVKVDNLDVRGAPESQPSADSASRVSIDPDRAANGIARLVLALIKFLHELMQRQALRKMEKGGLSPVQVEQLGVALMKQAEELDRLRREFGLEEEELNLDLGPLGRLV